VTYRRHIIHPTDSVVTFQEEIVRPVWARRLLAGLRIVLGFTFLWPFLDKLFGLGYMTPAAKAWIHGGTPAQGFRSHAEGPFAGFFSRGVRTRGARRDLRRRHLGRRQEVGPQGRKRHPAVTR
jgi:hypothetical protein